jgi:hypothetical protein
VTGLADLILTNGRVQTHDAARRVADAIAVRQGRIVAVGPVRDVQLLAGSRTRVIDLGGRMVLPGFQDAHVHPPIGGLVRLRCDLHERRGLDTYLQVVRDYAESHPDEAWIRGGGWHMPDFPGGTPRREDLDRAVPDRPVYLRNRDVHGAWVNTRALERAEIGRDTPDPPDGRIERDSGGMPSGTLHEGAMRYVERLLPPDTAADLEDAIRLAQAYLHSFGITAWQDAWVTPEVLAAYRALDSRGELTARVVAALWWERERGSEQIDDLIERRGSGEDGRFRATSVKIMQDGVLENFTGAVLEPYLDRHGRPTTNRGISFVDPEALKGHVARLDAAGFQVHFHAIGERAVREALDAVEAARKANGATDRRHHIAHLQVVHPDDLPRFRTLGVVANAQPIWAFHGAQMDELTIPHLGPERSRWQYPFASLRRAGAALCMGSDWSVSSANPLLEIEVAVHRVGPTSRDGEPFLPEERLDLPTALEAFTIGSAFVNHLDEVAGSLEVGKAADLVVLDRDLFAPDAGPVGDARVLLTLVGGEPVFEDPGLDA